VNRRAVFLAAVIAALPGAALAQPANRATRHDEVLGRDFDALPPGAKDRVSAAFRGGTPDITEAQMRERWNAMTPDQRGEVLTIQDRRMRGRGRAQGPRDGSGSRRGAPAN
jgi:hypothetical protein